MTMIGWIFDGVLTVIDIAISVATLALLASLL